MYCILQLFYKQLLIPAHIYIYIYIYIYKCFAFSYYFTCMESVLFPMTIMSVSRNDISVLPLKLDTKQRRTYLT